MNEELAREVERHEQDVREIAAQMALRFPGMVARLTTVVTMVDPLEPGVLGWRENRMHPAAIATDLDGDALTLVLANALMAMHGAAGEPVKRERTGGDDRGD